ncbi:MAG: DUF4476 domain-containing protein [Bacteroidales bacterium]|nr:DUF4476 domain-containing protein [Bacteroidales bacterium]
MKKLFLSLTMVLAATYLFAQPMSNFVFFSEDGYPFNLIMNGIQENQNPQTNVRVTGLTATNYKVRIIFEDKTIPVIEKNVFTKPGIEITYVIKKNKKGVNILRYYSEAPIPYEEAVVENIVVHDNNANIVTEEVIVHNNVNPGGVNIDVNVNGSGINYNMNANDGSVSINANIDINGGSVHYDETVVESETHYVIEDNVNDDYYQMPGYNGRVGCPWPMNPQNFQKAKQTISNADFSSDKQTIAKQIVNSNCLTAQQVREVTSLFDFEEDKLEFAKFAYTHTFDVENYFIINDIFDFSSSIEELDNYINTVRW